MEIILIQKPNAPFKTGHFLIIRIAPILLILAILVYQVKAQFYSNPEYLTTYFLDAGVDTSFSPSLINVGKIILTSDFYYNQAFLEKSGNSTLRDIGEWHLEFKVKNGLYLFKHPFLLNSSYSSNKKYLILHNDRDIFKYKQQYQRLKLSVYTSFDMLYLTTAINIRQENLDTKINPDLNMEVQLIDAFRIGYRYKTMNNVWQFKAKNTDNIIDFDQKEFSQTNQFSFYLKPDKKLQFKWIYSFSKLNPGVEAGKNEKVINAKGSSHSHFLCGAIKNLLNLDIIRFSFKKNDLSSNGHLYSNKEIFGNVTTKSASNMSMDLYLLNIYSSSSFEGDISFGNANFEYNGYMDTWPYSDFWTDLLGIRYWAESQLDYHFFLSSVSYKNYFSANSFYKLKIAYEQLRPHGELKTWQPDFLVFGIKNLQTNRIEINAQHGVYFEGEFCFNILKNLSLAYLFSQYIPVYSAKRGEKNIQSLSESHKNFKYGGGQHAVTLQLEL